MKNWRIEAIILAVGLSLAGVFVRNGLSEFSSDISTASLDLGTKIMLPNSDSEGKDSVDLIRDSLFSIQVEQPWLLLQFGNSNAEEIGADRVEALVSVSPEDEDGKTREEVVKTEIEDNDNNNLTFAQHTFLSFSGYKENLRHHCQRLHLHILVVFTLTRCFGFLFSSYAWFFVMFSFTNLLLNTSLCAVSFETA